MEGIQKKHSWSYYVKSLIGILIMILFPLIPAPAPITSAGMMVIGQLLGLIFLWSFVDMMWPTFLAIILFGLRAKEIYPNSWQINGIYEAGAQSFGNWMSDPLCSVGRIWNHKKNCNEIHYQQICQNKCVDVQFYDPGSNNGYFLIYGLCCSRVLYAWYRS